jgi:hypothetical protein
VVRLSVHGHRADRRRRSRFALWRFANTEVSAAIVSNIASRIAESRLEYEIGKLAFAGQGNNFGIYVRVGTGGQFNASYGCAVASLRLRLPAQKCQREPIRWRSLLRTEMTLKAAAIASAQILDAADVQLISNPTNVWTAGQLAI